MDVECIIPVLGVSDLQRSLQFYTETLEFELDWSTPQVGSVSKDGQPVMLSEIAEGSAVSWVWIGLKDDSLFEKYSSRGVKVVQEASNYSWAYEMKFADLDGNVLWLGTEPRQDMPLQDQAE